MRNLEETFRYDDQNRLTEVRLGTVCTGASAYDSYGRMTAKTAGGQAVFSSAVYNAAGKPHAMAKAAASSSAFPEANQAVDYSGFDKVCSIKQGRDSLRYTYGYDHRRIAMTEYTGDTVRSKRYVGACEQVTVIGGNTASSHWLTHLAGPTGVYAVVEKRGGEETLHYILKDNLGSWTAVTDSEGNVEQRLSYDAWASLRDPDTWSGSFTGKPMFDRGFTGHEHLTAFGLINMKFTLSERSAKLCLSTAERCELGGANGRMYDPVMSSFLSVDRFFQDPSSSQGFNRYAYCMYNPLRYVDPSGWEMVKPVPGRIPSSADYTMNPYAYAERPYEARDFRNPYYQCNMALYGNMGGPCSGGTGLGGGYYGSYGYYVTQYANSVYNYSFLSSMLALMQDWQNNPCYSTNKALGEAGIFNMTAGEMYGELNGIPGYRNTHYTWTDANGNTHTADALNEYVGGNANGVFTVFNMPLEMYDFKYNIIINRIGKLPYALEKNGASMQRANYKMNYNVVIDAANSSIYVNANSYNTLVVDGTVIPYANATLLLNNKIIDSKPLLYNGESIINTSGFSFVGSASFSLPSSGNIELRIKGGWSVNFYPCGYCIPTFLGIPISADTTLMIP